MPGLVLLRFIDVAGVEPEWPLPGVDLDQDERHAIGDQFELVTDQFCFGALDVADQSELVEPGPTHDPLQRD